MDNVNILGAVERWVKAFHAALYREPLPPSTSFGIETPFTVAVPTRHGIVLDTGRPQHLLFVETVKCNRMANNVDTVVCNNGKVRYECVWRETSQGSWVCIFGLDIYDWKDLGKVDFGQTKGCVGFYECLSGVPPRGAAKYVALTVVAANLQPFDPFGP